MSVEQLLKQDIEKLYAAFTRKITPLTPAQRTRFNAILEKLAPPSLHEQIAQGERLKAAFPQHWTDRDEQELQRLKSKLNTNTFKGFE